MNTVTVYGFSHVAVIDAHKIIQNRGLRVDDVRDFNRMRARVYRLAEERPNSEIVRVIRRVRGTGLTVDADPEEPVVIIKVSEIPAAKRQPRQTMRGKIKVEKRTDTSLNSEPGD